MVTVKKIAETAGVSRVCASQVLNNTPNTRISKPTRDRVLKIARQMGFVPRFTRQPDSRSSSLAYLLCTPTEFPVAEDLMLSAGGHFRILNRLQHLAALDNRAVFFFSASSDAGSLQQAERLLQFNRPLGLVLDSTVTTSHIELVQRLELPFVVAGVTPFAFSETNPNVQTVSSDPGQQVQRLLEWFGHQGCRRVALATGPTWLLITRLIIEAYQRHVRELGMAIEPGLIQISETERGVDVYHRYDQLGVEYDGILFGNWGMAVAAMPLIEDRKPHCRVGTLGFVGIRSREVSGLAICGPPVQDYTLAIYDTLNDQIHGKRRRVPHVFPPAILQYDASRQGRLL